MRTVEAYIAGLAEGQASVVSAVAALVRDAAPQARESIKWAQPVWEVNGPVCYVKAFVHSTNFGFWRGAELAERIPEAEALLLGKGSKMRHLRLVTPEDLPTELARRLVHTAVELNQRFGDPTRGEATRARP